jgi:hypothetical protein
VFQLPFNTPDRIKEKKNDAPHQYQTINVKGSENADVKKMPFASA